MKALSFTLCLALLILASCSTTSEDALNPNGPDNSALVNELRSSDWLVQNCPIHAYLTINGHNECEYLETLIFKGDKVDIHHKDASYLTPHHICTVDGNRLVVSIQDCENTTWKPLFYWNVVSIQGDVLIMDVEVPEIAPGYKERFQYIKVR